MSGPGASSRGRLGATTAAVIPALILAAALAGAAAEVLLEVTDAWITEPPPGSTLAGGYLAIANRDNRVRVLERVTSPDVARIELHRTEVVEGLARMREVQSIELAPAATTRLAPGGYHLMLHLEGDRPHAGEELALELHFDGGETLAVTAEVRRRGDNAVHHHHP